MHQHLTRTDIDEVRTTKTLHIMISFRIGLSTVFENTSIGSSLDDCQIVSHEGHSLEWGRKEKD